MATGFETWLTGYAAGKISDTLLKLLREDTLFQKLHKAIDEWKKELPQEASISSSYALFPNNPPARKDEDSKARKALQDRFKAKQIPTEEEWFGALIEQWRYVKKTLKDDAQALFQLEEEKAEPYLKDLAERLKRACNTDDAMRNQTMMDHLELIIRLITKFVEEDHKPKPENLKIDDLHEDHKALLKHLFDHQGDCMIGSAKGEYDCLWVPGYIMDMQWGWERTPAEVRASGKDAGDRNERLRWIYVVEEMVEMGLLKPVENKNRHYTMTLHGLRLAKALPDQKSA